jgi:hypothetical protein
MAGGTHFKVDAMALKAHRGVETWWGRSRVDLRFLKNTPPMVHCVDRRCIVREMGAV